MIYTCMLIKIYKIHIIYATAFDIDGSLTPTKKL
jgi:hypothetical protein